MARESFRPIWTQWWRRLHRSEIVWCLGAVAALGGLVLWRARAFGAPGLTIPVRQVIIGELDAMVAIASVWPLLRIVSRIQSLQESGVIDQIRVTPITVSELIFDLLRISWLLPVLFIAGLNLLLGVTAWQTLWLPLGIFTLLAVAQAQFSAAVGLRVSLGQRGTARALIVGIGMSVLLPLGVIGLFAFLLYSTGSLTFLVVAFLAFVWWEGRMAEKEVNIRTWAADRLTRE